MSKGVENALDEFIGTPEYAPRAVVLITDSPSACNADAITISQLFETYDDTLHTLVTDAYNEGILTYVIGIEIPNTTFPNITDGKPNNINPLDKLNELAVQGGRPLPGSTKFYHLQDELEFKLSLQNILEDAKSCNLVLGNPATLPTATVVEVAGKSYDYEADLDCATDDGWIYLDDTYTAIQLCGASCAELKSAGTASVTIGC